MKDKNLSFIDQIINVFSVIGKSIGVKKLSPEQIKLIDADVAIVNERCKKISDDYYQSEERLQKFNDEKCPNCGATRSDIVNKIREVHGSGEGHVSGNLFGVYGSSSMSIGTAGVNHCNKCGNEWKKYKKDFKSTREVVEKGLRYVARLIQDPVEYKWAHSYVSIFDGCYVETILRFKEEHQYGMYSDDDETLCFSELKDYFKSVWDDPNIKKEIKNYYQQC